MAKNPIHGVLKKVFHDITNIEGLIADTKEVEKALVCANFDDTKQSKEIVNQTKALVERLKGDAVKISDYFEEEFKVWESTSTDTENQSEKSNTVDKDSDQSTEVEGEIAIDIADVNNDNSDIIESSLNIESDTVENLNDVNHVNDLPTDQARDTADIDNIPQEEESTGDKDIGDTGTKEKDSISKKDKKSAGTKDKEITDMNDEDPPKPETKVFLKCIDISKLKARSANDSASVLVISDSDNENDVSVNHSGKDSNKLPFKISDEITVSKITSNKPEKGDVQADENSHKPAKETEKKKSSGKTKNKSIKDYFKVTTISSSDDDKPDKVKNRGIKKLPKFSLKENKAVNAQKDKKFGYAAYVPLVRYPCEKLKKLYLEKLDHNEIRRLTDLSSLSKRKRESGSESSSSDTGKKKKKKTKQTKKVSKDGDTSCMSDTDCSDTSVRNTELQNTEASVNPAEILLNDVGSATDVSVDEDNKKAKKKSKKKESSEDSSDNKKEEKSKDKSDRKKSKWRRDKLLTKKIESDSDSDDDDLKAKKYEKLRKRDKKKISKTKKVIDSESSSDDSGKKKKKKKKASSSESASCSSSSSSSSESDSSTGNKKNNNKKKGGRIKRVKESSSEDEDNKETRKTIRKVIAHESLEETTKQAEKDERERKARIAERQKKYNAIFESDRPADASVDKLVLDFDDKSKEELLSVNKELVTKLKPHQAKGIQFMWDACFESLDRTKSTNGSGCILAHCMGLGKTLQVIAFVHTLINNEKTGIKNVMVVCPVNTVLNWVDEFKKWLGELDGDEVEVFELVTCKQVSYREYLVKKWSKDGGALIIGYDMFRNLTNQSNKRLRKATHDIFQKAMVNPGPDLIICDEGHLLKNEKTNLSIAISRVRTERRIILTGTPMQNNMKEYYCMVQFVKPNLLGTFKEYLNRFVNPITNGQYTDSTPHDISIMKKRSHVLHKMLDGIVQRKDYNVLAPFLPPKYEYVLFTKLSEIQIKLYQYYLDNLARRPVDSKIRKAAFLFTDFQEFQRICTHPRVLLIKSIENQKKAFFAESSSENESFIDDDDDKSSKSSSSSSSSSSSRSSSSDEDDNTKKDRNKKKSSNKRTTRNSAAAAAGTDIEMDPNNLMSSDINDWWSDIVSKDKLEDIAIGGKLFLLFEILQQCELIGDKILIFSQSLYSLNIIEYFLHKIDEATQNGNNETVGGFSGSWALGLDYFRIDGSSSCDNRAAWCKSFNSTDNHRARLFLISTKAGGLGINLVGANRVIIFDVSWNPSHDTQSIYRVYRFGQTKPCYIYRFVTWGSMEMKIYERQVTKQAISKRIIDEQQIDRHYNQNDLAELYLFDPSPTDAPTPLLPKDVLLAELLQNQKDRIYKYHEHQSLLENKEEEELNEAERKAAWEEYEHEKTNPPVPSISAANTGGWIKHLPITSITAALTNILQKDNPTWTREQVQAVIPIVVQQLREQVDKGETLLFNRIVNELKSIQALQQQKLQQYYLQQQIKLLQQRQTIGGMLQNPAASENLLRSLFGNAKRATNPNEVVELND